MKVTKADVARLDALVGAELDSRHAEGGAFTLSWMRQLLTRAVKNEVPQAGREAKSKAARDLRRTARDRVPQWSRMKLALVLRAMGWETYRERESVYWHMPWEWPEEEAEGDE